MTHGIRIQNVVSIALVVLFIFFFEFWLRFYGPPGTKNHTQTNTHRHLALKSNKHYRNFIDCLTNKMKCYSTTPNTFGRKY